MVQLLNREWPSRCPPNDGSGNASNYRYYECTSGGAFRLPGPSYAARCQMPCYPALALATVDADSRLHYYKHCRQPFRQFGHKRTADRRNGVWPKAHAQDILCRGHP